MKVLCVRGRMDCDLSLLLMTTVFECILIGRGAGAGWGIAIVAGLPTKNQSDVYDHHTKNVGESTTIQNCWLMDFEFSCRLLFVVCASVPTNCIFYSATCHKHFFNI